MKRLVCAIVGHRREHHEDGLGAAWDTCGRCDTVLSTHSWHGGRPWLGAADPGPTREPHRTKWLLSSRREA